MDGQVVGRRIEAAQSGVEVKRRGVVRRAKLYYLRDRRGKSARIAERAMSARGSASADEG